MRTLRPSARSQTSLRSRSAVILAAIGLVAAACGTGDSATDAGIERNDPATTVPAADDATTDSVDDVAAEDAGSTDTATDTATDPGEEESDPDADATETSGPIESSDDEADATDDTTPVTTADDTDPAGDPPPEPEPEPQVDLSAFAPCPVDALDAADGPVEITMWFGLSGDLPGVLQSLTDEYNASQDGVVVNIENQTDYEAVIDKFVQFGLDERPELVLAPEFIVQSFAESELFVPSAACVAASGFDTSSFLPGALGAYEYGGVQWGLPFNASNPVLYYNRSMFEAAGLDPDDPPLTFDEVRAVSQALVDSGEAAAGLVVDNARDSGSGGASFEQWFGRAASPFADNDNGRAAPATEVFIGSDTGVDILTFLRDMVGDGLAVSVGENAGGQAGLLKLIDQTEPAAMVIDTSAALGTVLAALGGGIAPDFGPDDVGVGFMPGPTDQPGAQIGGGSLWIPDGKGDASTAAAWDFVQFLVDAQTQSTWAAGTGYIPVRVDAVELDPIASTFVDDPRFRVAYDQLLAVPDDPLSSRPILGPQREIRQEIADAIATVYADPQGADVSAILDQAQDDANSLVANYNALN